MNRKALPCPPCPDTLPGPGGLANGYHFSPFISNRHCTVIKTVISHGSGRIINTLAAQRAEWQDLDMAVKISPSSPCRPFQSFPNQTKSLDLKAGPGVPRGPCSLHNPPLREELPPVSLAPAFHRLVSLGKAFSLPKPQFPHL